MCLLTLAGIKYEHIFIPEDVENILREIRSRINEEYHGENIKGNLFVDSMGDLNL